MQKNMVQKKNEDDVLLDKLIIKCKIGEIGLMPIISKNTVTFVWIENGWGRILRLKLTKEGMNKILELEKFLMSRSKELF